MYELIHIKLSKFKRHILPLVIASLFLTLSACGNVQQTEATPPQSVEESAAPIAAVENPPETAVAEVVENSQDNFPDYEIYDVLGTADSIKNTEWDNMLAARKEATVFSERYRDFVFVNMEPDEKVVYLTFDDGPDLINTVSVMNTLIEYNAGATFFFTGENIERYGDVVKQVYDNGFTIGLHSYDHASLPELTEAGVISQLEITNTLLEDITGKRASIMRPPYGDINDTVIETIRTLDERIYMWSLDTLDWAQNDKNEILRNIKENLRPGDIILMHAFVGQSLAPEILPEIIEFIQSQGYQMKALPEPVSQ